MIDQPTGDLNGAPAFELEIGQATSVGQVRSRNEDAIISEPLDGPGVGRRGLFCAVADGMGGHAGGDVASALAVSKSRDAYYGAGTADIAEALRQAIEGANREIYAAGAEAGGREQMGSTITAVVIAGERAVIGQVGDTRCYIIEDGDIRQLTRDHSWVADEIDAGVLTAEQARAHPRRNIITRALGLQPDVKVDLYVTPLREGSTLVLCSDGLHGPVEDGEILEHATRLSPQQAADTLVALANERGGPDNIAALVVAIEQPRRPVTAPDAITQNITRHELDTRDIPRSPLESLDPAEAAGPVEPPPAPDDGRSANAVRPSASVPPDAPSVRPGRTDAEPARGGGGRLILLVLLLLLIGAAVGWFLYRSAAPGPLGLPAPVFAPSALAAPLVPGRSRADGPVARAPGHQTTESATELVVIVDEALVRLAPVLDAPVAAELVADDRLVGEVEVFGEPVDGDYGWYLVSVPSASPPARGFIHRSLVRELP